MMKGIIKRISYLSFIFALAVFGAVVPVFAIENEADSSSSISLQQAQAVKKISFDDVWAKAKNHAYDLKIADYDILIAKQEVKGVRAEYFPKLAASAGTEYTKNYRNLRDTTVMSIGEAFINPYTRYQSVLGITLVYNLFDFGIRGESLKAAKEEVSLKELELKEKLQELHLNLLDTYTKILITTRQIELNKEIISQYEKNLGYKERLVKAKEISKTDLNDAKKELLSAQNRINELNSIRAESLAWLSFYTGESYDNESIKVEDLCKPDFDVTAFNDYTKSIVWQIHEKQIKKKEHEIKIAKRTNYPKVNVYGRYYLYGSDYSSYNDSLKDIEPSNFTVGGSVNMTLFDGLKNQANIKKNILEMKELQVERDKAIAQLMTRLAAMRANLIYLDKQIDVNNDIIKELNDKEKSVRRLVSKRVVSPMDEVDAKVQILEQKIELSKNTITKIAITKGIQILTEEE